jgi:hypothetical protein
MVAPSIYFLARVDSQPKTCASHLDQSGSHQPEARKIDRPSGGPEVELSPRQV